MPPVNIFRQVSQSLTNPTNQQKVIGLGDNILTRAIRQKKVPTLPEIGTGLRRVIGAPKAAIRAGMARDRAAVDLVKEATGLGRKQVAMQGGKKIIGIAATGVTNNLATGVGATIGASVAGVPGAYAGHLASNAIHQKVARDINSVGKAITQVRARPNYSGMSKVQKAKRIIGTSIDVARQRSLAQLKNETIASGATQTLETLGVPKVISDSTVGVLEKSKLPQRLANVKARLQGRPIDPVPSVNQRLTRKLNQVAEYPSFSRYQT